MPTLNLTGPLGTSISVDVPEERDLLGVLRRYGRQGWTSGEIPAGGLSLPLAIVNWLLVAMLVLGLPFTQRRAHCAFWRGRRAMMQRFIALLGRPRARVFLTLIFCASGLLHFLFPLQYGATIPPWLPAHAALVAISGACEIAGGLGLLLPLFRRAAGFGLLLLCVAVWPANLQMLLHAMATDQPFWQQLLLALRLPLQLPLMLWIWSASRR